MNSFLDQFTRKHLDLFCLSAFRNGKVAALHMAQFMERIAEADYPHAVYLLNEGWWRVADEFRNYSPEDFDSFNE